MYGESNMETYITTCKIDSQCEFAVWLRKLKQGLCISLEGWDGEGGSKGGGVYVSVQFSHSVVSNSLSPHEPQHPRPPCPSPTPRVYSNSCPLSE